MSAIEADFDGIKDADAAYYGDSDGDGTPDNRDPAPQDPEKTGQWGKAQEIPTNWVGGWSLMYQPKKNDPNVRRHFVIRVPEQGTIQALTMSAQIKEFAAQTGLEKIPSTRDESEAREAYNAWVEAQGGEENVDDPTQDNGGDDSTPGGEQGDDSTQWSDWTKITQAGQWTIWGRQSASGDRVQFMAASLNSQDQDIYLQPDGSTATEAHLFESQDALKAALQKYQQKAENGEVPEGQRPTGRSPDRRTVSRKASRATTSQTNLPGPAGDLVQAVGGTRNALILGAVVVGGAYYAEREGYIDLTESIPQ